LLSVNGCVDGGVFGVLRTMVDDGTFVEDLGGVGCVDLVVDGDVC
jgi:hypothetical protein